MLTPAVVDALKRRYAALPPLLVHRSVERAASDGDLFDILDTVPAKYPVVWDEAARRWVPADLFLPAGFEARS